MPLGMSDEAFRKAMENANKAQQFTPLAKKLTPKLKGKLKKLLRGEQNGRLETR